MSVTSSRLHVRKASLDDWDEIRLICKDIWGGEDYVPDEFPKWIEADNCHPFVLEDMQENRLRAVVNIRVIDQGETAWFEGIRVDPTYQGKGLGSTLTEFIIAWSRKHLPTVKRFRLMIAEENWPSLKLAKKFGLEVIETSIYFRLTLAEKTRWWNEFNERLKPELSQYSKNDLVLKTVPGDKGVVKDFYLNTWKSLVKVNALLAGWSFVTISPENVERLANQWTFLAISSTSGKIIGMCGINIEKDQKEGKSFLRLLLHATDELVPLAVKKIIAHLKQQFPDISIYRWHVQANGKTLESMLHPAKEIIDFFRFYLLERAP